MFGSNTSGGTGLFGNHNKSSSFSFGSASAPNNAAPNGANANSASTPGSGFSLGGSNSNALPPFGAKPAAPGFGAAPAPSGGLFGNAAKPAPASGGLFGSTTANSGSAPGSAATNSTSGGLFGGSSASGASNGGNLFGNNASSNTAAGGLFGSKPASSAGTSGGLFGSTTLTTNSAPGGGLFGGNTSNTANSGNTGGLFGSNANANGAANTNSGGLFGKPAATSSGLGQTSSGLFGASQPTQNGLFSNNQNQNQNPNQNQNQNQTQNQNQSQNQNQNQNIAQNSAQPSFGWSKPAGSTTAAGDLHAKMTAASKNQQPSNYTPTVNDQLTKLKEQWDPNSGKCALKTHVYNKFSEQEIGALLQQPRPANESPEDWEAAMAARPSPLHFPVKVASFSEVAQRVEVQLDHVAKSRVVLNNIHEKVQQLSSQRDLDTTTRILKARVRHTKLSRRLLKLAALLAVLKLKGYPLLPEEEEMSRQFQALNAKISDPNGAVGKLSDLYARLAILKGRSEDLSSQLESSLTAMNGGLSRVTNDEPDAGADGSTDQIVQSLTRLLYKQQVGLNYVNDIVQQDLGVVGKAKS